MPTRKPPAVPIKPLKRDEKRFAALGTPAKKAKGKK